MEPAGPMRGEERRVTRCWLCLACAMSPHKPCGQLRCPRQPLRQAHALAPLPAVVVGRALLSRLRVGVLRSKGQASQRSQQVSVLVPAARGCNGPGAMLKA